MVKTKILATLGPACCRRKVLVEMIRAGLDAVRVNFSHGTHQLHAEAIANARAAAEECDTPLAIMGDLCGPKIRTGRIDDIANTIQTGDQITIERDLAVGNARRFGTNYPRIIDEVEIGHRVLIDDGLVRLRVEDRTGDHLMCVCEVGGTLSDNKGMNLPDSTLSTPAMTEKDTRDLALAIEQGLDFIALSFVRRPDDVVELREALHRLDGDIQVVVKVETPQAVQQLDPIIELSDMILVARGDLGVEMDLARVPLVQKDIIARCSRTGTPAIVATQMLQSMVSSATPTRAEVSDVANAILDGCDAVMLSAETAVGSNPVEAVRTMNRIATETEAFQLKLPRKTDLRIDLPPGDQLTTAAAIARSAAIVAADLGAKAIVARMRAGRALRLISKYRPPCPVIGLASDDARWRSMALYYGVEPVRFDGPLDQPDALQELDRMLMDRFSLEPGDLIVIETGGIDRQSPTARGILIHPVADQPTGLAPID